MIVFGPVTSRRLGKSLGINHIPPKYCTYSCVYCQVGNTIHLTDKRQHFYEADQVFDIVRDKLEQLKKIKEEVDFITLVPDGEPTLDKNLGELIDRLKALGPPVAVISNGSLMHDPHVRESLLRADWISAKIDILDEENWRAINRPQSRLDFTQILEGIEAFSQSYKGIFVTETMLIRDINDKPEFIEPVARFIKNLNPRHAYLLIPTRPPAESWVLPPDEEQVTKAYYVFKEHFPTVTLLIDFPDENIPVVDHLEDELLAITSVHPVLKEDAARMLAQANADQSIIDRLVREKKVMETHYQGNTFYVRKYTN